MHIKKLISICFLVTVCSLNLLAHDKNKKEKICISEQEFAVYEVIGIRIYQNETDQYPFSEGAESQFLNISSEVIADYKEKNSKTYLLRCVLKKDQLKKKLETYSGRSSDMSFSRIGFNKDETEALVYMGWSGIGNTCETDFYHLRKENDKWKIVKKAIMVIC
jgi:hypothetical protein